MYKHGIKKLHLHHEAIRVLSSRALAGALGGSEPVSPPLASSGDTGSGALDCVGGGSQSHQTTCRRVP
jgi:hypothetical protein